MPVKKKKRKGSKRSRPKGNGFENHICKDITTAFEEFGIKMEDAYRSKQSGGHIHAYGDIGMSPALTKLFSFAPECKWHKNVNLHDLLLPWKRMSKTKKRFGGWWIQTLQGAAKCKRAPLCIFKGNKANVLCAVLQNNLTTSQRKYLKRGSYLFPLLPRRIGGGLHRALVIPWSLFLASCIKVQKRKRNGNRKKRRH